MKVSKIGFGGFVCLLSVIFSVAWSVSSFAAEESSSSAKLNPLKQKTFDEAKGVTDAELRAKAGSRSKWSLKGYLGYSGPRIDRLDVDKKPNPDNLPGDYRTSASGAVGARFRFSPSTSISADTGLRFYSPLEGARDLEASDPRISLEKLYPLFGLQMRSEYTAAYTTTERYLDNGQVGALSMGHDFKSRLGFSDFLISVGSSFNWFVYDRAYQRGDSKVSNYNFSVYPGIQYNIMDNFNVGTSVAFGYSNLRREPNWLNWDRRMASQRLTFGYGVTRDIFVNPYLNFYPQEFTWDTTSVNLNLYISLF